MSAIGSFYLITDSKREGIVRAAEAQAKALTRKRFGIFAPKLPLDHDPFWDFVRSEARELDEYPYSGFLLLDLELLAPGSLYSNDEVGCRLSKITDSSFISFRPSEAALAVTVLESSDFSDEMIKDFLEEEGRADDYPDVVLPIQDSVRRMKHWLQSVSDGNTGILNIG